MILGIDEVGRGPWAGPLVVGAVVLGGAEIEGLSDSKNLSKKKRELFDKIIRKKAKSFGLGWSSAEEIDEIGLSNALRMATGRAVEQIKTPYSEIIIDGTVNFLKGTNKENYVTTLKKADLLVPCVSAASIIAKVARDRFMERQDKIYPEYGFSSHVGYGTAKHSAVIKRNGITKLHRLSFKPIQKHKKIKNTLTQTTKKIGDSAEDVAAGHLIKTGHRIIERNWKTKLCEIDIISEKAKVVYFTEVKYRNKTEHGGGLAAITTKKLRQMNFAAKLYVNNNNISETDLRLTVISLVGEPAHVEYFLEV